MIEYHIYSNSGTGGPVDYSTPLVTTAALTYTPPPLAAGSDWTFAVRAFDTVSGLEERNVDARVRVLVGAAGQDLSGLPNPPTGLTLTPLPGGGLRARWAYYAAGQGAPPSGFRLYDGSPAVSFAAPAATVPFSAGRSTFSADLTGLTPGAAYQAVVRAYNAAGETANAAAATAVVPSGPPLAPQAISAAAVP